MEYDILDESSVAPDKRMQVLAQAASALDHAVNGIGRMGPSDLAMIQAPLDQLIQITKRLSWIEKTSDPDWKPFDPNSPENKAWLRNKKDSTKKSTKEAPDGKS